jgi:HlyD family secretion protein
MTSGTHGRIVIALAFLVAGATTYVLLRHRQAAPVVGVVRATEIRVAPEVGGQLAAIKVQKGTRVRAGDAVAELSIQIRIAGFMNRV